MSLFNLKDNGEVAPVRERGLKLLSTLITQTHIQSLP